MDSRFFLYLVTAFFVIDAVVIVARGLKTSAEFNRYLRQTIRLNITEWFQDAFKRVFHITWHKDSLPYFIFFSTEDFNDPRIAVYKGKLRWSFYGFLLNGIAAAVSFAIFGILASVQIVVNFLTAWAPEQSLGGGFGILLTS